MIKTYKPNDSARIEAMLFTDETVLAALDWAEGMLDSLYIDGELEASLSASGPLAGLCVLGTFCSYGYYNAV